MKAFSVGPTWMLMEGCLVASYDYYLELWQNSKNHYDLLSSKQRRFNPELTRLTYLDFSDVFKSGAMIWHDVLKAI